MESIDLKNQIKINSQKAIYSKKIKSLLLEIHFEIKNNYKGKSSDVSFLINDELLFSKKKRF